MTGEQLDLFKKNEEKVSDAFKNSEKEITKEKKEIFKEETESKSSEINEVNIILQIRRCAEHLEEVRRETIQIHNSIKGKSFHANKEWEHYIEATNKEKVIGDEIKILERRLNSVLSDKINVAERFSEHIDAIKKIKESLVKETQKIIEDIDKQFFMFHAEKQRQIIDAGRQSDMDAKRDAENALEQAKSCVSIIKSNIQHALKNLNIIS